MVKLMSSVGSSNSFSSVSSPSSSSRRCFNSLLRRSFPAAKASVLIPSRIHARLFSCKARASIAVVVETKPDAVDETKLDVRKNILACPICFEQLIWRSDQVLSLEYVGKSTLQCSTCRKSYSGKDSHIDLTINGGGQVYGEPMAISTELFRLPLVSYLYERGWRQSFSFWGGFPGPEKEFELVKGYLKPVIGGNIVDASCGSGLFSRLFVKSGLFSLVVALDFSETMLKQCYDFIKQENSFPEENIALVRADISRLPFGSGSLDAVHAGAALHCWPSPSAAVAEISRVLKPGGIFVASTYILDGALSYIPLRTPLRRIVAQISGSHSFLSETELNDLCTSCGLVNFNCTRNGLFVMISARKPS